MRAYIPARLNSSRFPEKVLCQIDNKSLVSIVAANAASCDYFTDVIVLCDDQRIKDAIEKDTNHSKISVITGTQGESGSDRIFKYRKKIGDTSPFCILQADCPDLTPMVLNHYMASVYDGAGGKPVIHTILCRMDIIEAIKDQNVKAVRAADGKILYFSRLALPYMASRFLKHVGVYTFTKMFLDAFPSFEQRIDSMNYHMALTENLEQLSWMMNGYDIHGFIVNDYIRSIDIPSDYAQFPD